MKQQMRRARRLRSVELRRMVEHFKNAGSRTPHLQSSDENFYDKVSDWRRSLDGGGPVAGNLGRIDWPSLQVQR